MTTIAITAGDVRRLNECGVDAALVRWADTGETAVLPSALFSDVSFDDRYRDHEVVITRAGLRALGNTDWDDATDDDYAAWAETLTETLNDAR
jgi:hypothetical protein